jgi:serine/threonine protein kinase
VERGSEGSLVPELDRASETMSAPQPINRATFLANLRQSKLLSESQLSDTLNELPATARGRSLARAFVEKNLLTRFQAERLLAGRNTGFLIGQYRILDQLGRGGMGRVFKAEHKAMKRLVALKVLTPKFLQSDRARELFHREAQAAARLVHPNVVAAFDAGEADGHYFLVLEYVDGPNLDQLVRKQGPLPVGLACEYIMQTANGLQAAHSLGMVHRDIKPANLLVQRWDPRHTDPSDVPEHSPGVVKISDFGLARLHSPVAGSAPIDLAGTICIKQNTVMGTPDFLSPEQARDLHSTDIRSDLYSLGCTFYYLLAGQVPFPGGTALEKLICHNAEEPVPLENIRSDVPAEVIEILQKLIRKHPEERFQTPRELAEALEPHTTEDASPWKTPAPPSNPMLDIVPTPSNEAAASSPDVLEGQSWDEGAALESTDVPDLSPTFESATIRPLIVPHSRRLSRWEKTLFLCFAGVAALLLIGLAFLLVIIN